MRPFPIPEVWTTKFPGGGTSPVNPTSGGGVAATSEDPAPGLLVAASDSVAIGLPVTWAAPD